ncbi:flagellar biosynthesis protein FlhG [Lentibacillus persicus]|uniref:Flagellar biosynthesis protein FlhG n=1 Tax=Lentibacillus persicus TaxID=640948 RepID=A0A1I1VBD5_9BACI|nr:MinD/ParA family protein [Lentibacillus persicus]SFD80199.1 flagellar biosynthesis protein FlhG [Lentibacillus persicus]
MIHDQAAKLRQRMHDELVTREAKTIAIASGKGGVGKSNVALNFSLELASHDNKVLLFDLDIGMGNVDILLGLESDTTLADMFENYLSIHDVIKTGPRGMAYAAAGSALNDFFSLSRHDMAYFFQQYEELIPAYDYIIFDMGAGASFEMLSFVFAANECIVVTTPEPTSITDAYGLIKYIANSKPDMPVSVIMNRSRSVKNGQQALERFHRVIEQFLEMDIRKLGILPEDKTVSDAVLQQTPYILLNDKAAVSKAMKDISKRYIGTKTTRSPGNFVQRLKRLLMD